MVEYPSYAISKQNENYNLLKRSNTSESGYQLITSNSDLMSFLQSKEFHREMSNWKSESEIIDLSSSLDNKERDKIWQMLNWYIKKEFK